MSFQIKEPILIIGIGGVGSKLALDAKKTLNLDCLVISNDKRDIPTDVKSIHVTTDPVINPSVQLIRGSTYSLSEEIESKISGYSTLILISNLAGKAGSAMAPVVSEICKKANTGIISFAVMPFKYEKNKIFNSGIALKRIKTNSNCTVILDNDSLLESNPDLSPNTCYNIANSAMMHVIESLGESEISSDTNIISTSKNGQNMEDSLRDSLKMLYDNAPSNSIKRSMLYVVGGNNIPTGIINSITNLSTGIVSESNSQIDMTSNSKESKIIMLSSIQGMSKFDKYDPLGIIPQENTLDWTMPDCSIDCELDLYQLE